jgi:hypothetical protein
MQDPATKNTSGANPYRPITFDLVFSYWIFTWFLVYMFASSKTNPHGQFMRSYLNPKLAIIAGIIENTVMLGILARFGKAVDAVIFAINIVLVKVIPLLMLMHTKINWKTDVFVFLLVFSIYNLYLIINNTNLYEMYILMRGLYSAIAGKKYQDASTNA